MGLSTKLLTWRATAVINTAITTCLLVLMLVLLGFSIRQSGAVDGAFIFHEGQCDAASRLNTVLHLVINIISTGVLASSNYFMKILLSPTRKEIDHAHRCGRWLDIGILSIRNFRAVSMSKRLFWILFAISSLPIHLFLNSVMFTTGYLGSDFDYTIASEAFVNNGSYYLPGASLPGPLVTEAADTASNLTDILKRASLSAGQWQQLNPEDCRLAHFSCSGRRWFRDVVVVVDVPGNENSSEGWIPAVVFRNSNESDSLSTRTNSLWNSSHCSMHTSVKSLGKCESSCEPMVIADEGWQDDSWTIPFYHNWSISAPRGFDMEYNELKVRYCLSELGSCKVGLSSLILLITTICVLLNVILCFLSLWVLRVHNPLVTLGDAMKSFIIYPEPFTRRITATHEHTKRSVSIPRAPSWALDRERPQRHRTSRGNKIFLSQTHYEVYRKPPRTTSSRPRIALNGVLQPPGMLCNYSPLPEPTAGPDHFNMVTWKGKRYLTFDETSTPGAWLAIWILFLLIEIVVGNLTFMDLDKFSFRSLVVPRDGGFGDFEQTPLHNWLSGSQHGFLGSILLANIPQVLISLIYFQYSTSVTRTVVAEEWAHFSISHQPLRVTNPAGDQVAPYFFDMPCKYAIPLTALSIMFHWLVSQAIYMVISEGGTWPSVITTMFSVLTSPGWAIGYIQNDGRSFVLSNLNLAGDAVMGVAYSRAPFLIFMFTWLAVFVLFNALSYRPIPGRMPLVGSNSMAIAACCQVLPHLRPREGQAEISRKEQLSFAASSEENCRKLLSRGRLKWGAGSLSNQESHPGMRHLGFGNIDDVVESPELGQVYVIGRRLSGTPCNTDNDDGAAAGGEKA